ncbi:hypothetical protein BC332_11820 [Capsicum chinense]|nr:hypothetical protein BC332_11820 [Capsicum chinense]
MRSCSFCFDDHCSQDDIFRGCEIGPILFELVEYNGSFPKFVLNPYAWTKVSNFLFIDSPVGTGFSYARTPAAKHSDDLRATYHAYEFLPNWFVDHQEFLNNPVYVGGESYSGRTVPIITQNIAIHNEMKKEPFINLKGYVLGNPLTYYGEGNYRIPFAHGMGLISDELYESLMTKCNGDYLTPNQSNTFCLQDVETFKELIKEVNNLHILEPKCNPKPHLMFGQRRSLDEKFHQANNPRQLKCREDWYISSNHWGNDAQVQEALNIRKGFIGKWARCRHSVFSYYKIKVTNTIPYHVTLSSKGYRFLIYSGDHDKQVPFQSTIAWIKSLNYSVVDEWRPWFVDDQVAGEQGILHRSINLVKVWRCLEGDALTMEETTTQTVDSNEMENMRITFEAMTRALERLSTEVGAIRGEVTTISGKLEQVESQRSSRPSTP